MLRGINRQTIFEYDEDCEKYLQCLEDRKTLSGYTLHAYCLMGNHLHLLIREGKEPLEMIFKRIGARYVFWYNWKYKQSGHLFQDRFKSEPVDDDAYFMTVLRYIYQNPVKAGLCIKAEEYSQSSYGTLGRPDALVDHSKALELLPEAELRAYIETPPEERLLGLNDDFRLTDHEAAKLLKTLCGIHDLTAFQGFGREVQAKYIYELAQQQCSIRQLVRLTGVSKAVIERMLRS